MKYIKMIISGKKSRTGKGRAGQPADLAGYTKI